ncbi:MAG: DegT/DnrJ/EryC1/StrS family aminotransferase [Candidatus Omnitrophica bacterium]|nr:DegT/DnrJ/EryC1/StrS family aminotransferase [Candidatus Omnitrophota bacterium]
MSLIPWWKIDLGQTEIKKIVDSINNRCVTQGSVTEELEVCLAELLNVPYVVLTTNGSSALLMALLAFGVNPGDEVIVPGLTFVATAQAPLLLGAKIKLVDVGLDKPVIDVGKLEKAITAKTKAIIPVHLNGRAADIKRINKIAAKYGIKVIEDAVQAFGVKVNGSYLGTQSDLGVFSLGITKLITSIRGGFLAVKDKTLAKKLKKIRNHGLSSSSNYSSSDIMGFNFEFNDVLASVGLVQTQKIKEKIKFQKNIYAFYKQALKDLNYIKIIKVDIEKGELPLWMEVVCKKRDKLIDLLKTMHIQAKPFYPALSSLSYLKNKESLDNSKFYASCGLILPSGDGQSRKNLEKVVKALRSISSYF